ncbi:MAG TPA: esterase [Mycobacterium sp.]|jgi:hypothetical protein
MTRSLRTAALLAVGIFVASVSAPVTAAQSPCVDLGGSVDGDMCRIHSNTDTYSVDINFPVGYPDTGPLTDYVRQTRDGFVNVSQMPGSASLPYALDITSEQYQSGQPPQGTQSVVLKIYQNVGGAHPLTWYKSFTYNLATRQPITFDTLFTPGSKPLPVILPIVQREIDKELGSGVQIPLGDGLDPSHYQNFAITDDELIFFFGQNELLPSAAGAQDAHVPRSAVASMLAPLPA